MDGGGTGRRVGGVSAYVSAKDVDSVAVLIVRREPGVVVNLKVM